MENKIKLPIKDLMILDIEENEVEEMDSEFADEINEILFDEFITRKNVEILMEAGLLKKSEKIINK
jgi:hypothetical protein